MTLAQAGSLADGRDTSSGEERRFAVVFVSVQFHPIVGGAEVRALRDALALRAEGHDVRVVTLRHAANWPVADEIEGVPVRRVGGLRIRGRLRLRFGMQWLAECSLLRELIRSRHTYQLIHLRQLSFLARPAALAALMLGKPLIVRLGSAGPGDDAMVRPKRWLPLCAGSLDPSLPFLRIPARHWVRDDLDTLRRTQWLAPLTLRLLSRRGVLFVATSSAIRTLLLRHGMTASQVVVLPNGIEPAEYAATTMRVDARRASQHAEPATVLCISRFRYEKGLDVLLQAWAVVLERFPRARLVLVGGGVLRPQLEALAAALALRDSVRFVDLAADVRPFLAEADSFVLPSRWEGMPNALLEAMACGLPCVATRVSGCEDLIVDGVSGLLVPPEDPEALAHAIVALLADPMWARTIGTAAREHITRHYQQSELTDRLVSLYAQLAPRQPISTRLPPKVATAARHLIARWHAPARVDFRE